MYMCIYIYIYRERERDIRMISTKIPRFIRPSVSSL